MLMTVAEWLFALDRVFVLPLMLSVVRFLYVKSLSWSSSSSPELSSSSESG